MPIELVTTDGIFALDGGEWEVTNNIWLVGDDREVVVFDAAHDHQPIVDAINGRRVGRSCSPTATTTTSTPPCRCATRSTRRCCSIPTTACCGTSVWPDDSPDGDVEPTTSIVAAGHELRVVHTPGHSPGCCCFHDAGSGDVFSGDTLFCGGPGATGRSYSDEPTILRSIIDSLLTLPPETVVHTGHGESTTIGAERDGVLARAAELGL